MKEKVIAIIPARSGSKGISDKNIKELHGKPLIAYTIEAAIKSNAFEDVVVSTDSEKYKCIAEKYGAWVPFLRPKELSEDTSSTNDVIEDVLIKLKSMGKEYESFMILQPTSPLRDEKDIVNAIQLFYAKNANSVVSMCECEHSPILTRQLDHDMKLDGFLSELKSARRQDMKKFYRLNGAIYLLRTNYFLENKDYYKNESYAYIMENIKSIDIDENLDFIISESIISNIK
jgi:CMP-N-acetylneuraminic acid synthetase